MNNADAWILLHGVVIVMWLVIYITHQRAEYHRYQSHRKHFKQMIKTHLSKCQIVRRRRAR